VSPRAFSCVAPHRGAEMRGVDKLVVCAKIVCLSVVKRAGRDKLSKVAIKYGEMLVAYSGDKLW
jgi:hypothetical protein